LISDALLYLHELMESKRDIFIKEDMLEQAAESSIWMMLKIEWSI